jgi:hypothetical protein
MYKEVTCKYLANNIRMTHARCMEERTSNNKHHRVNHSITEFLNTVGSLGNREEHIPFPLSLQVLNSRV